MSTRLLSVTYDGVFAYSRLSYTVVGGTYFAVWRLAWVGISTTDFIKTGLCYRVVPATYLLGSSECKGLVLCILIPIMFGSEGALVLSRVLVVCRRRRRPRLIFPFPGCFLSGVPVIVSGGIYLYFVVRESGSRVVLGIFGA